jgi:hypothetical protein
MTTERSDKLLVEWKQSIEKFDYYVLGIAVALFAYSAKDFAAQPLGLNATTVEAAALSLLLGAIIVGFLRIQATITTGFWNHQQLYSGEVGGSLTKSLTHNHVLNEQTGETYSPQEVQEIIRLCASKRHDATEQVNKSRTSAERYYDARNILLVIALIGLLAGKLLRGYGF